ncbi:MAG TPA: hypothetical protein DDX98_15210 [Bacteroidales bacterium]|jgi:hypothetical protein|nr:hypothetical protein [Bacteroidales bacterium]
MESTQNKPAPAAQPQPQPKKKVPMYLIAILVTLGVIVIALGIKLFALLEDVEVAEEAKAYVEQQKDEMEGELNELIVSYDSLKTNNDSINERLAVEQDKIRRLLRVQATNAKKLQMYEKELGTLRRIMRSYIVQIDSLNTRNRELTEENIAVRQELREKEENIQKLSETQEELSSVVAEAQKLAAKNIVAVGLNSRSKPKDKISKIEKLRVCFIVRENNVAEAGSKMIYVRIIRPDEVVLSSPDAGMFDYQEESLVYSAKRELEYDNQDIDMCIFWDKTEELIEGTYFIALYSEGYEIGTSSITLK